MLVLGKVVDLDALWQTCWTAALAGVGVTVIFSLCVLGSTRSLDMSREHRGSASAAYAVLALLGLAGTLGVVVYAIVLITTK